MTTRPDTQDTSKFETFAWGGLAVLISLLVVLHYLTHPYSSSHETERYPTLLIGLCHALAEGCWDARWLSDFSMGYGLPLFNYYPPGFIYVAAIFHGLGLTSAAACKAGMVVFAVIGCAGAYLFGRALWRSTAAGFIVAVVWAFFPYRAVNLYVRGDHSELAAMSLMFWALLGHLWIIRGGGRRAIALAACAHAAILWTHVISSLLFQAFLILFDRVFTLTEGQSGRRTWMQLGAAHALALSLGSASWMPAFFEMDLVHMEQMANPGIILVLYHLVYFPQLFKSDWDWGYSQEGPIDMMPYHLGTATLLGAILGLAGLAYVWRRRPEARRTMLALGVLSALNIFLMLTPAFVFWKYVKMAQYVQFPWRMLMLVSLTLPVMAGPAAYLLGRCRRFMSAFLLLVFATVVTFLMLPSCQSQYYLDVQDEKIEALLKNDYVNTGLNDYIPRDVPYFSYFTANWQRNRVYDTWPPAGRLELTAGQADILEQGPPINNVPRRFKVRVKAPATFTWNHFYFPGWHAVVDGRKTGVKPTDEGRIQIQLPPGEHQVAFKFGNTPLRAAAKAVSLISLALVIAMVMPGRQKKCEVRNTKRKEQIKKCEV